MERGPRRMDGRGPVPLAEATVGIGSGTKDSAGNRCQLASLCADLLCSSLPPGLAAQLK